MNWGAIYASTLGFYDSGDRYQLSSLKWVQTDDGWHWTLTAGSTDTSTGGPSLYPVPAVAPADPSGPLTGYGEAGSEADTCVMYQFPSGCLDAGSPWPVSSAVNVETNIRNYFFDYGLGTYSLLANQACWQTLDCTAFRLRAVPNQLLRAIGERAVITAVTVGTTEPTGIPGTTFDPCTFGAASQYGPCVDRTQMTPDGPQETATATIESNPTLATAISAAIDTATPSTTVLVPACNGITYDACVVLLQAAGLVGTTTRLLGDPGIAGDALYSPGFVEYTSPSPGEAVAVDVAVQVAVYANPDGTDPTTSGSGGTTTPEDTGPSCNCPSLDFTPLQVDVGGKFPFGAFTWVKGLVDQFGTSSETPSWTLTKPSGLGGGAMTVTAPANVYRDISDAVMKFIVIVSSIWFAGTWIVGWNRGDGLAD